MLICYDYIIIIMIIIIIVRRNNIIFCTFNLDLNTIQYIIIIKLILSRTLKHFET